MNSAIPSENPSLVCQATFDCLLSQEDSFPLPVLPQFPQSWVKHSEMTKHGTTLTMDSTELIMDSYMTTSTTP